MSELSDDVNWMTVNCPYCKGSFKSAGNGPKWGHDTNACLRDQFTRLSLRVAEADELLCEARYILANNALAGDATAGKLANRITEFRRALLHGSAK